MPSAGVSGTSEQDCPTTFCGHGGAGGTRAAVASSCWASWTRLGMRIGFADAGPAKASSALAAIAAEAARASELLNTSSPLLVLLHPADRLRVTTGVHRALRRARERGRQREVDGSAHSVGRRGGGLRAEVVGQLDAWVALDRLRAAIAEEREGYRATPHRHRLRARRGERPPVLVVVGHTHRYAIAGLELPVGTPECQRNRRITRAPDEAALPCDQRARAVGAEVVDVHHEV